MTEIFPNDPVQPEESDDKKLELLLFGAAGLMGAAFGAAIIKRRNDIRKNETDT